MIKYRVFCLLSLKFLLIKRLLLYGMFHKWPDFMVSWGWFWDTNTGKILPCDARNCICVSSSMFRGRLSFRDGFCVHTLISSRYSCRELNVKTSLVLLILWVSPCDFQMCSTFSASFKIQLLYIIVELIVIVCANLTTHRGNYTSIVPLVIRSLSTSNLSQFNDLLRLWPLHTDFM